VTCAGTASAVSDKERYMRKRMSRLAIGVIAAQAAMHAGAAVLDFEGLPIFGSAPNESGGYFSDLAGAEYNGFRFGNTAAQSWYWNPNPDADPLGAYNASSGRMWVGSFTGSSTTSAITSATAFVFNGASFAGYEPITYELSLNNTVVFSSSTSCVLTTTHQFCASGYSGLVDSVVIKSNPAFADTYFAMDDFTYNEPVATVPVPATGALVAGSLALLALTRRHRGRAA
jgi:hypothetical protein